MLFKEMTPVRLRNVRNLFKQNVVLLILKKGGAYRYQSGLKG